ncbi:HIT-like domain [Dillenia turbinata]|uniref:HIT-like domain n=1 Tax=Dillenia turbinata TaxID=194707 RepID=A0AAN8VUL8_9MAGN
MESGRRVSSLSSHLLPPFPYPNSNSTILNGFPCVGNGGSSSTECLSEQQNKGCIFCRIVKGESPAFKLYEDGMCLCILDTHPLSHGHSLIIPKSHFCSLEETPPAVVATMCSKVPHISKAIMKATGCGSDVNAPEKVPEQKGNHLADSFNLLVNSGAAAGQVIFHTHVHIIPRKKFDCLWASEGLRRHSLKLDREASGLADRIRQELNNSEDINQGSSSSRTYCKL